MIRFSDSALVFQGGKFVGAVDADGVLHKKEEMREQLRQEKSKADVGDVVQIAPESHAQFGGQFMVVTEVKGWGYQGYCQAPGQPGLFFYRVKSEDCVRVGKAEWVAEREED